MLLIQNLIRLNQNKKFLLSNTSQQDRFKKSRKNLKEKMVAFKKDKHINKNILRKPMLELKKTTEQSIQLSQVSIQKQIIHILVNQSRHNLMGDPKSKVNPAGDTRRVNNNIMTMNIMGKSIMMRKIILKAPNNMVDIKLVKQHTIRKLEERVIIITNREMINQTLTNHSSTV